MSTQTDSEPIAGELLSAFLGTRERITRVAAATGYGNPDHIHRINSLIEDTADDQEYIKDVKFVWVGADGELVAIVVYAVSEAITDEAP